VISSWILMKCLMGLTHNDPWEFKLRIGKMTVGVLPRKEQDFLFSWVLRALNI
jgi:hypothetical protein